VKIRIVKNPRNFDQNRIVKENSNFSQNFAKMKLCAKKCNILSKLDFLSKIEFLSKVDFFVKHGIFVKDGKFCQTCCQKWKVFVKHVIFLTSRFFVDIFVKNRTSISKRLCLISGVFGTPPCRPEIS